MSSVLNTALLVLAVVTFGLTLVIVVDFLRGVYSLTRLSDVQVDPGARLPSVTVIIPARNEQRNIEHALQSVLKQDLDDLEIIVINDRSTDRTGEVLERLAGQHPRLVVEQVTRLPDGWLGKNHANYLGSQKARGEILLFTDADIVMEPGALRTAVFYMQKRGIDHLAATPDVIMPGVFLNMFAAAFKLAFLVFMRPWRASDPRSRHFIGIGAFNLVRRRAYEEAGTHRAIAMRPDDDIKLGKLLKRGGFRQELVLAAKLLVVEWYASLREVMVGLEKNAFSGVDYSVWKLALGTLLALTCNVWPFAALVLTSGLTWCLNLGVVLLVAETYWPLSHGRKIRWWYFISLPIMACLFQFIIWRAVVLALRQGGIRWRDTVYPLAELKANRV